MDVSLVHTTPLHDTPALRAWINSSSAPLVHQCAYFGDREILRDQIASIQAAEIYRQFVESVTRAREEDPLVPLTCKGTALGIRLSQIFPYRREDLENPAGPFFVTPMQLAMLRGHRECIELLGHPFSPKPAKEEQKSRPTACSRTLSPPPATQPKLQLEPWKAPRTRAFTSKADKILREYLPPGQFDSHVAHVIMSGRKYILIADGEKSLTSVLVPLTRLIESTYQTSSMALFLQGVPRSPVPESSIYQHYLGAPPRSHLYGMEDPIHLAARQLTAGVGGGFGGMRCVAEFVGECRMNPDARRALWELGRREENRALVTMVNELRRCINPALSSEEAIAQCESLYFLELRSLWSKLHLGLVEVALDFGWIPNAAIPSARAVLRDPTDKQARSEFIDHADRLVAEANARNIARTVRDLPDHTEIVVFLGVEHMSGLVAALSSGTVGTI